MIELPIIYPMPDILKPKDPEQDKETGENDDD
ncbi:hypothetical protein [Arthronema virus TR020]|uniref:Uncharacterized protein n=1 Tax=Arthronema virus TR020 TaxID=2736280 RepID=A0A7G3WH17_9CAUD|nr:hypothetical protein [Arthronema virus TR020]